MPRTLARSRSGSPVTSPDGEDRGAPPSRSGRRRRRLLGAGLLVVILVAAIVVVSRRGGDEAADTGGGGASSTAEVSVQTLTQSEEIAGTLGFGEVHSLTAGRAGTLTSTAAAGSTVDHGGDLFSVDRQPTVLLFGQVPVYRDLDGSVDDGPDVAQLEENLVALGYTDDGQMVVDEHFDDATADAVEAWQEARGVEVTGTVGQGDVVFLPGAVRMAEPRLDLGATVQAGEAVVDYSSTTQSVQVQLEIAQADLAQVGDGVSVRLPDGSETAGTVTAVADASTSDDSSAGGAASGAASGEASASQDDADEAAATVDVTVSLDDPAAATSFTTASVDVLFTSRQVEDVLTVPVAALLALLGGGYAVEVPNDDGTSRFVPVEPGLFADGYVEITGDGIDEGTPVVVPE
jgi:peptidoglycan hydrolase-like protein with peptidoglycan-binding domain